MTPPRIVLVPVEQLAEALRPFANSVFNDNGDVTFNLTAYSTDDLFRAYGVMKRYDALAASPPPPVAGDEGTRLRRIFAETIRLRPVNPDAWGAVADDSDAELTWRVTESSLDEFIRRAAAPPPPPADLKAEAERVLHRAKRSGLQIESALRLEIAAALAAAHAAGKAEAEAETENLRTFFGGMTPPNPVCGFSGQGITQVWGDEKSMAIVREAMHCRATDPTLRVQARHWREECGKLHSQIDRAKATARAEALEEAARVAEERHSGWSMPHPDDAEFDQVCDDLSACADIARAIRRLSAGGSSR